MSGSARSLQMSFFTGLRVASTTFTPEYSKNGKNVSAKLVSNSFMNIASRANDGAGRNEAIPFTIWGKLAHTCAKAMSPGKEWHCLAQLHVYMGRVFKPGINGQPGTVVLGDDGQPLLTKKFSYTVSLMTFGEESNKHIQNEMQAMINGQPVRPADWNVIGSPGYVQWRETLKARMAVQFDPNLPTYGYARILMPQGQNIGAYITNEAAPINTIAAPNLDTAAAVAATFGAVNPAANAAPAAPNGTVVNPGGFVMPAGV